MNGSGCVNSVYICMCITCVFLVCAHGFLRGDSKGKNFDIHQTSEDRCLDSINQNFPISKRINH